MTSSSFRTFSLHRSLALIALALIAALMGATLTASPASAAGGVAYYVDSQSGNDANSGTSAAAAWKSLDKVNLTTFQPGDSILLASGSSWTGAQLWPKGSGSAGADITIDSYGSGALPRVEGAGRVDDAVKLWNQQYWSIRHLDVSNANPATGTAGANLKDLRGIHIGGDTGATLNHFVVDGVDVHDVTGEVNWIGGSADGNAPGVTFATGWDRSKRTGGIVFEGSVADQANPGTATVLNDMTVENSSIARTSFAGIVVKQYTGSTDGAVSTGWGERANATDPKFTPHTNLVVRNNYITQDGTDYGCNGMYLTDVRGGTIEGNVIYRAGTSGLEMYYADQITVQHNEIYETQQKAGGADSNAVDPDKATTNIVVQNNYLHDNGDGVLICQFSFGNAIIRNNVIANNTRYQIYLHSDKASKADVYNNTIVNNRSNHLIYGYGSSLAATYSLHGNVLWSSTAGASLTTSPTIDYENNYYGGASLTIPDSDTQPVLGDIRFAAPDVTGPYGTESTGPQLATAHGYKPLSGSAAVNTGQVVEGHPATDYAGDSLYNGAADLGAFEYRTPAGATTESVTGAVRDGAGRGVSETTVTVSAGGAAYTATTDATGRYSILKVPFDSAATVTASKPGFTTATHAAPVVDGNATTVDLTIASSSTEGNIRGSVFDDHGSPLAGAAVSVSGTAGPAGSAKTDSTGSYLIEGVQVSTGYTVTARASGFISYNASDVSVTPAATTTAESILLEHNSAERIQTHDFENLDLGALPNSTDGWTVSQSGGSVGVVKPGNGANQVLQLDRATNSGSTSAELDFAKPIAGLVTVEADVLRVDPYTSGNDFFALPYIWPATGSTPGVAVGMDRGLVKSYIATSSTNVGSYDAAQWYHLRLVIDTVNQRYDMYLGGDKLVSAGAFRTAMPSIARIQFYANSSNYGTAQIDNVRVAYGRTDAATAVSASGTLSTTQGWAAGLRDGHYEVRMDLWWGSNATEYRLYENGKLIDDQPLLANGKTAQHAVTSINGRANGTYVYTAELVNARGSTATSTVKVTVADAAPAQPAISNDNRDGDGSYAVSTNLWWGTNATTYRLYENGVLLDTRSLAAATPGAQHVTTFVVGRAPGSYAYRVELENGYGTTSSSTMTVVVKK